MRSKYDRHWRRLDSTLSTLLADAARHGQSESIAVSAVRGYGKRDLWSGMVVLQDRQVIRDSAAHLRALGSTICALGLTDAYPGILFSAKISKDCCLQIRVLSAAHEPKDTTDDGTQAETHRQADNIRGPGPGAALSRAIHGLIWSLPRYHHPIPSYRLPPKGLYFLLDEAESTPHGPRIVRVGIDRSDRSLPERVNDHFDSNHHHTSVVRRHVGHALLVRDGASREDIRCWRECEAPMPDIEARVTAYIRDHFDVVAIGVNSGTERAELEAWLIGVLSAWPVAQPSEQWLGNALNGNIKKSGLWNVHHVLPRGTAVDPTRLACLQDLAKATLCP